METALAFFITVLTAIVCWLICTIYIQLLAHHYSKKIIQSDVSVSCRYRNRYRLLLKLVKLIYLILAFVSTLCIFEYATRVIMGLNTPGSVYEYTTSIYFWIIFFIICLFYGVLMLTNTSYSPFDIVTSLTKNKVKKDYILFLRGFGVDNYLTNNYQDKNKNIDFFSEHNFIKRLSLICETYAIGRPEELKNPSGATRIYLDNATWQSDIQELMTKAKCVIILVNDKPNCIWEIAQSESINSKVIYIVNNKSKYQNVCHQLPQINVLDKMPDDKHFYFYYDSNYNLICKPYKNTGNSYWDIIKDIRSISNI